MKGKYKGIFKYSPTNLNPTQWKKGDEWYSILSPEIQSGERFLTAMMSISTTPEMTNFLQKEHDKKMFNLLVKQENNIFYIADEDFNILFETSNIWYQGNFTDDVINAIDRFGLKEDTSQFRLEATLDDLKEAIRMDQHFNDIPSDFYDGILETL